MLLLLLLLLLLLPERPLHLLLLLQPPQLVLLLVPNSAPPPAVSCRLQLCGVPVSGPAVVLRQVLVVQVLRHVVVVLSLVVLNQTPTWD